MDFQCSNQWGKNIDSVKKQVHESASNLSKRAETRDPGDKKTRRIQPDRSRGPLPGFLIGFKGSENLRKSGLFEAPRRLFEASRRLFKNLFCGRPWTPLDVLNRLQSRALSRMISGEKAGKKLNGKCWESTRELAREKASGFSMENTRKLPGGSPGDPRGAP